MARRKPPRRGPIATLVNVGLSIPREATRMTAAGIREVLVGQAAGSIDIVDRIAKRYGLPRSQIADLLKDTLENVSTPAEAVRAVQALALSLPGGALRRAQGATLSSLSLINEVAGRVGLPGDVLLSTLLAAVGKDWEQLARRQREKIRKAQKVVEQLSEQAEEAEEELAGILGTDHPISWHLLSHGPEVVREELQKELHALRQRPGVEPMPERAPETPRPRAGALRPKAAASAASPAKPKPKPKAKAKAKAKPKATTRAKAKPRATTKPKPAAAAPKKAKSKPSASKKRGSKP